MTTPARRRAAPVTIYLHGGIASLTSLPPLPTMSLARQDGLIVLGTSATHGPFVLHGDGTTLQANAALVAPFTRLHMSAPGTPTLYIAVHLTHPRFRALQALARHPLTPLDRAALAPLDPLLQQAGEGTLGVGDAVQLIDDVLAVVLADAPEPPPLDERVRDVMSKLDLDIGHPFARLAEEAGLSPSRLSHLFSQTLGVSFRSYVAWGRLMLAWELVALKPELNFTQVAHRMGYADSAHLARSFHAFLGMTPTLMRDRRVVNVVGSPMPKGRHLPWAQHATPAGD